MESSQIGSDMFLHELVCERGLLCLVLQMVDHGMEYRAKGLQETEGDEANEDGEVDEQ